MSQQQPDISAILAALSAGQRPGSTPATAQPPNPVASPSNGSSMPLPQPSNSGNLDLSAIKPTSTGSVSLADAIAKARGIAAEKASSREDPRLSSRNAYGRSRSRSRSPVRRDNYRDNYNPYRDERRDDARRGQNGRERSFSPGDQNRSTFSPGRGYSGRERTPPRQIDENSEIITVDSNAVGLIIGRAGENLRRVESETGARVQFITGPESSGPQRQCKISGTFRQRSDAKREIFRTVDENPNAPPPRSTSQQGGRGSNQGQQRQQQHQQEQTPPLKEGERQIQIMVPDRTVGLIIGRGGETIRDLQDRSGCHVNIVGENKSINGLRPVNLIGTPQAQAKAKELIMEVVESDTRVGPPPTQVPQLLQQPQVQGGRQHSPYDAYGGASYDPYGGQSQQKMNDTIMVPSEAVGMIIGKGGETIKEMQNSSSCKINVSSPSGPDFQREIGLIGTRVAIDAAKRQIWEKVETVSQREKQQGGRGRGAESTPQYGEPYSQQQPYGQQPSMLQPHGMPPAPGPEVAASVDPYAAYGGYQNYAALWYAALANSPGGQHPPSAA